MPMLQGCTPHRQALHGNFCHMTPSGLRRDTWLCCRCQRMRACIIRAQRKRAHRKRLVVGCMPKSEGCWLQQAVEELNVKPKNWKDLLDDTPFTRRDIIHLQDPLNLQVGGTLPEMSSGSL